MKARQNFILSWLLIAGTSFFDTFAVTIIKIRLMETGMLDHFAIHEILEFGLIFLSSPLTVIAIIAFFLGPFCWFLALNRIHLSIGYPLLVIMHFLFIIIFSTIFLDEKIDQKKFIAMICIVISLFFFFRAQQLALREKKVADNESVHSTAVESGNGIAR